MLGLDQEVQDLDQRFETLLTIAISGSGSPWRPIRFGTSDIPGNAGTIYWKILQNEGLST